MYATYDRELLAIYSSIKYFRHLVEGRNFTIYTDHKPLIFAFRQKQDKFLPWQFRYLDFIAQYSTDIRYLKGSENCVADAFSRINALTSINTVSDEEIALAQANDSELQSLLHSAPNLNMSLRLEQISVNNTVLYCDTSKPGYKRPFVPLPLRFRIFAQYHNPTHPGVQ